MVPSWLIRILALAALLLRTLRRRRMPQLPWQSHDTMRSAEATFCRGAWSEGGGPCGPCGEVRCVAYSRESCRDCRIPLPGRIYRLMDASYCRVCHEAREAELDEGAFIE